jgi:hypothetical protein
MAVLDLSPVTYSWPSDIEGIWRFCRAWFSGLSASPADFPAIFPLIISLKRHLIRRIGDEDKGRNNLFKVMPTRSPTYAIRACFSPGKSIGCFSNGGSEPFIRTAPAPRL